MNTTPADESTEPPKAKKARKKEKKQKKLELARGESENEVLGELETPLKPRFLLDLPLF